MSGSSPICTNYFDLLASLVCHGVLRYASDTIDHLVLIGHCDLANLFVEVGDCRCIAVDHFTAHRMSVRSHQVLFALLVSRITYYVLYMLSLIHI